MALIATPYDTRNFTTLALFQDEFLFSCHAEHALSQKIVISDADLKEQDLMLLEEGHCLRSHVLSSCHLKQHRNRTKFEASSFFTLVQMVASGIGVTLLPKLAIEAKILAGTELKIIPMANASFREITLVWRKSSSRSHEYTLLAQTLIKKL